MSEAFLIWWIFNETQGKYRSLAWEPLDYPSAVRARGTQATKVISHCALFDSQFGRQANSLCTLQFLSTPQHSKILNSYCEVNSCVTCPSAMKPSPCYCTKQSIIHATFCVEIPRESHTQKQAFIYDSHVKSKTTTTTKLWETSACYNSKYTIVHTIINKFTDKVITGQKKYVSGSKPRVLTNEQLNEISARLEHSFRK
jgi:hypothetical protein